MPVMPLVYAVPRYAVSEQCRLHRSTAVISISAWEDGDPPDFPSRIDLLRLTMSDIHCGGIWDRSVVEDCTARGMTEPARQHVEAAIAFARSIGRAPLIVHCSAGISRSPAIALAIIAEHLGPGRERDAVDRLFSSTPQALPNPMIVEIADQLLSADGRLVKELALHLERVAPAVPEDIW